MSAALWTVLGGVALLVAVCVGLWWINRAGDELSDFAGRDR